MVWTIFAPTLAIKDVIGINIKKAGIFTKPKLKGRFAFSKKPDVKKPIEPIDAIINPIAAELPIALLIGYPKYLRIGTFIIAPVIPIGADIKPEMKPNVALGRNLNFLFFFNSCFTSNKYPPKKYTTTAKNKTKDFVFNNAAMYVPSKTPNITNRP